MFGMFRENYFYEVRLNISLSECVRGNRSRAGLDEEGGLYRRRRRRRGHSSPLTLGSSRAAGGNSAPTYTGHQESTTPPLLRDPKDVKCENHKKAAKRR